MTDPISEDKDEKDEAAGRATPELEQQAEPAVADSQSESKEAATAEGKGAKRKLNAEGRERPQFLLSFPDDPALNELVQAFERGDYAHVRRQAPLLAEQSQSSAIQRAALELSRRIEPDPLLKYLLVTAVLLLVFLSFYAYQGHAH